MNRGKKGDIEWDTIIWWIIAIAVLVFIIILSFTLKTKGVDMLNYFKQLFSGIK